MTAKFFLFSLYTSHVEIYFPQGAQMHAIKLDKH